jgi:hypothetical protein
MPLQVFARAVHGVFAAAAAQLFNFQWLARSDAGSLFLLFTYSSRRRLFIDQTFFEQNSWPATAESVCPLL